jgi:uncharacterized repeat protein (TIGR01451 family)
MQMLRHMKRWASVLATVALSWSAAGVALAVGTDAGTTVSNTATVDFTIGTVAQPTLSSNAADFVVDRRVDMTLTAIPVANVTVTPATTGNGIAMTLTNTSNATLDFGLAAANIATPPFGGVDNFDPAVLTAVVSADAVCDATDIGGPTVVTNLAEDASVTVCILANIAAGTLNNSLAAVALTATAREPGGGAVITEEAGPENPAVMETVFADTAANGDVAQNGTVTDDGAFQVVSADVTITKTESLISDPINGNGADRRHIPGAIVEYTVTVTNAATSTLPATALTISDVLQADVTFNPDTYGVGQGIQVDGAPLTNAADADAATFAADTVTVTVPNLAVNTSVVIVFRATVD